MKNSRDALIQKIAALRAKTEAAGASEHEAMAAAEKAAELMAAHEIEEAELAALGKAGEEKYGRKFADGANGRVRHLVWTLAGDISLLTQTKAVAHSGSEDFKTAFVGARVDVELAIFLHDTIRQAMDRDYVTWRNTKPRVGKGAKRAFQLGMAKRIGHRLRTLREAQESQRTENCRALVVDKAAVVEQVQRQLYPHLGTGRRHLTVSNAAAFGAGKKAGEKVGLGRPVRHRGGPALIKQGR
jgi:hypothetical protein